MKKSAVLVITVLYIGLIMTSLKHLSADESYMAGRNFMSGGDFGKALDQSNKSIKKNPREPRYYYGRARIYLSGTLATTTDEEKHLLKQRALEDLIKAEELNPKNLVTLRNMVPVYYFLAIDDLGNVEASENIDSNYAQTTKDFFNKVKNYSSTDVGLPVLTAKYERRLGFYEMLENSKTKVRELRPDLLEWHPNFID